MIFIAGKGCEFEKTDQFRSVIARHLKKIGDLAIEVVVNFGIGLFFSQQHRRPATIGFDVDSMWRQVLDDPRCEQPFPAVIAHDRSHI